MIRPSGLFVPKRCVRLLSNPHHNILGFRVFFECSLKLNFTLFLYSPTLSVGFRWSLAKTRRKLQANHHKTTRNSIHNTQRKMSILFPHTLVFNINQPQFQVSKFYMHKSRKRQTDLPTINPFALVFNIYLLLFWYWNMRYKSCCNKLLPYRCISYLSLQIYLHKKDLIHPFRF